MSETYWLWAWGAVGALIFAGPVCAMKLNAEPAGDAGADRRRRKLAIDLFWLAIVTGAAFAQAFASTACDYLARIVHLPLTAAALSIGVSANFLWPKILRRWGEKVDGPQPPTGGA